MLVAFNRRRALGPKDQQLVAPSVRAGKLILQTAREASRAGINRDALSALRYATAAYPALTEGATNCWSFGPQNPRRICTKCPTSSTFAGSDGLQC